MTDLLSDPSELDSQPDEYEGLDPVVAKRLRDKDAFIKQLEAEGATYRNELRARTSLEEITERIARQAATPPNPGSTPPADPVQPSEPKDLSEQVLKILETEKAKANRDANTERARAGLKERFGADYNLYLQRAGSMLSVSDKFLGEMAATSPAGLLKLIDSLPLKDADIGAPPPSSVDTSKQFNQSVRKNAAYYSNLLKTNREKYLSTAVQAEMHNEALRQGDKFFE